MLSSFTQYETVLISGSTANTFITVCRCFIETTIDLLLLQALSRIINASIVQFLFVFRATLRNGSTDMNITLCKLVTMTRMGFV